MANEKIDAVRLADGRIATKPELNFVRLTDGRIVRPVEVDYARGFKGCVRLAESGEWLVLGPAPADAVGWTTASEPWVPRVGERVQPNGCAYWISVESVVVTHAWCRGQGYPISDLTPMLDASGRPEVERGVAAPPVPPWAPRPGDRCRVDVDGPQRPPAPGTVCEPRGPMVPGGVCVMLDGERAARCYVGVTPLRPTEIGQRVRCANGRVGRVEALTADDSFARVGPAGEFGLRTEEPTGTLVVLADVAPAYVPAVGDRVAAKGRTGTVQSVAEDPEYPGAGATATIEWDYLPIAEKLALRKQHGDMGDRWHCSAWPHLTRPAPPDHGPEAYVNGRPAVGCGKPSHATRAPGTTALHWWPCGCAVAPDGEDALGMVNGEPRGVLVWGHGATGYGFTRADAVTAWRAELAFLQGEENEHPTGARAFDNRSGNNREVFARRELAARKAAKMDAQKEDPHAGEKNDEAITKMLGSVAAFARFDYAEGDRLLAEGSAAVPSPESFPRRTGESTKRKRAWRRRPR